MSDTTKNQGGGTCGRVDDPLLLVRQHVDRRVRPGDRQSDRFRPLAAGASASVTTTLAVPAERAAGSYYVIAQADGAGDVPETTETNNTRASAAVKVGPDLLVTRGLGSGHRGGRRHDRRDRHHEEPGRGRSGARRPPDSTCPRIRPSVPTTSSSAAGRSASLPPAATSTGSTMLQIPADTLPGSYYVIGRADWNGAIVETSETNNDRSSGLIRIGGDLVVTRCRHPRRRWPSGPITVTDSTRNQGAAPVPESTTAFYLSTNSTYDATDQLLGSRIVGALGPSATSTLDQLVVAGRNRRRQLLRDRRGRRQRRVAESLENNNTRASGVVRIGPDFIVTALTAPSSAVAGTSITASDTTKNQGGDAAPASVTRFYLSSNSTFDAGDLLLGSRDVSSLGPGLSEAGRRRWRFRCPRLRAATTSSPRATPRRDRRGAGDQQHPRQGHLDHRQRPREVFGLRSTGPGSADLSYAQHQRGPALLSRHLKPTQLEQLRLVADPWCVVRLSS